MLWLQDDIDGPFDFRSILKKSEFAPTDSLRRRDNNRPKVPAIVKSPVDDIVFQQQPSVVYDDGDAIEL